MLFLPALILVAVSQCCYALLEEPFVAFESSDGAVKLHNATIVHDGQDPKAVEIAVRSLASDWEAITGTKAATCKWASNATNPCGQIETAIIAAKVDSALVGFLEDRDKLDVSDIQGKWETFKTVVVSDPLPGVGKALVIAGSDKRGAAFGLYTLAEQSGQSPYVFTTTSQSLLGIC